MCGGRRRSAGVNLENFHKINQGQISPAPRGQLHHSITGEGGWGGSVRRRGGRVRGYERTLKVELGEIGKEGYRKRDNI